MSLFAELKRRNVIRVGGAYLALGWIVTQITATIVPVLNMPAWVPQFVVWIGVIGFPFVLLFSWAYELTPEGLKRESEVVREASVTHLTARRLDVVTICLVVAAVVLYLVDPLGAGHRTASPAAEPAAQAAQVTQPAPPPAPAMVLPPVDARSIAVLPFVDMSAGKDQEYMSDGIAEELLNLLAKIPELKVTSRSSAFAFKGERIDIAEVARKLNVAHVLEGSVRSSGNRVRITAQLIDARTDQHLWSESYDRTLDDIFAVQDEIAAAVVAQLKVKLLGEAPKAHVTDPKAYALFLQARELGRVFTPEAFEQSNAKLQQVLEIDPGYAAAWERLATNYVNMAGTLLSEQKAYEMAREATQKALAIDPQLPAAHDSLGWIAMFHDGDLAAAATSYSHALALAPGDIDLISNASRLLGCLGRMDQSLAIQEYTAVHDPANPLSHGNLADAYLRMGRIEEATERDRTVLSLGSDRLGAHFNLGRDLLLAGDHAGALAQMQLEASPSLRQLGLALAWHSLGKQVESDQAVTAFLADDPDDKLFEIALLRAWRGENDAAFAALETLATRQNRSLCGIGTAPLLRTLHQDPRWMPFLQKIGHAPEQLAAIPFDVKLP